MKQILTSLLCLLLLTVLLSGCAETDLESEQTDTLLSQSDTVEDSTQDPEPDTGYTELTPRTLSGYVFAHFGFDNNSLVLRCYVPKDWELQKQNASTVAILREGAQVGKAGPSVIRDHDERCLLHKEDGVHSVFSTTCVLRSAEEGYDGYSLGITLSFFDDVEKQQLQLEVAYTELTDFAKKKLLASAEPVLVEKELEAGVLKLDTPSILILGNSFVSTSAVGEILQEMCLAGGHSVSVQGVSRGYATVSSYVDSGDYVELIRNGEYGILFMCGFYSAENAIDLRVLVDACKQSGTQLVIFPAHNETTGVISDATLSYVNESYFLDWKGEINALIRSGAASDADMCIPDQHKHSTCLAGFVGAHMIYRTLFGTVPPAVDVYGVISTDEAARILGDYVTTGDIPSRVFPTVYRFTV